MLTGAGETTSLRRSLNDTPARTPIKWINPPPVFLIIILIIILITITSGEICQLTVCFHKVVQRLAISDCVVELLLVEGGVCHEIFS